MRKKIYRLSIVFFWVMLVSSSCSKENFRVINKMHVYNIQTCNDSIFFSTVDSGIFRFSPDHPDVIHRVGGAYRHPIRSIAFSSSGARYAASYNAAISSRESLLPFILVLQPAWSIKFDGTDTLWVAGTRGIFKLRHDSLIVFNKMGEVHDIAFVGKEMAVAHKNGISIFQKETGALLREFCKGIIFWTIARCDSLLIGGGQNMCAIINKDQCKTVTLGLEKNMVWSAVIDSSGALFLATQQGLYRVLKGDDKAQFVGFKKTCIKSLLIDNKGRLWVGRFSREKRR
jgi:hypothetical protein